MIRSNVIDGAVVIDEAVVRANSHRFVPRGFSANSIRAGILLVVLAAACAAGGRNALAQTTDASKAEPSRADASKTVADLQEEIARLREQNARLQQQIAAQDGANEPPEQPSSAAFVASGIPEGVSGNAHQAAGQRSRGASSGSPETIVVTSARYHERDRPNPLADLQEVPTSISVVSGEELERFNTTAFGDILKKIANVAQSNMVPQVGSIGIRGVGFSNTSNLVDPSAGISIDGVGLYNARAALHFSYVDLDSVNVSRGPTGILGGRNYNAGAINFVTRAPSFDSEANFSLEYGSYQTLIGTAVAGGSVIDGLLAWRGTFIREQSGSPYNNLEDPDLIYRNRDRTYGRVQFLLTPRDDLSVRLITDFEPVQNEQNVLSGPGIFYERPLPATYTNTGAPVVPSKTQAGQFILQRDWFTQEPNFGVAQYFSDYINEYGIGDSRAKASSATLNVAWKPGDKFLVESISGYRWFYDEHGAVTFAGNPYAPFDVGRAPSSGQTNEWQASQEFRISSTDANILDYQAGVYVGYNTFGGRGAQSQYGSDAGAWIATAVQYNTLMKNIDAATQPGLASSGRSLLLNSLDHLATLNPTLANQSDGALYGNLNWHVTPKLDFGTGARVTRARRTDTVSKYLSDEGFGGELDPVRVGQINLGGFNSVALNAAGSNLATAGNLISATPAQQALADSVALKYFGVGSYGQLTQAQKNQVAAAKALRAGQLSGLIDTVAAPVYTGTLPAWNVGPSYKFTENATGYFTWTHGEKAGAAQISGTNPDGSGRSLPVNKEVVNAFELGLKSNLLQNTLTFDTAVFFNRYKDYIQPIVYYDPVLSAAQGFAVYTSAVGNVPAVTVKGVEVDTTYSGIPRTFLRLAAAYNDARYTDFKNMGLSADYDPATPVKYRDATGLTLPYASKVVANFNADYQQPLFGALGHADANIRYTSRYNQDVTLSKYSWVPGLTLVDLAIGLGTRSGSFGVDILAKNAFNKNTGYQPTWNTYLPTDPRTVFVVFRSKL